VPTHVARRNGLAVGEKIGVSLLASGIHLMPWEPLAEQGSE
jgi:molybdate transport system ATP-binding protein